MVGSSIRERDYLLSSFLLRKCDTATRREEQKIGLPKTRVGRYTPSSLVEHQRGPKKPTPATETSRCGGGFAPGRHSCRGGNSRVLLCAGVCGNASTTRPPG